MTADSNIVHGTLAYARAGLRVFPQSRAKIPLIRAWPDVATADERQIRRWWAEYPDANVACVLDRHVVVDIDRHGADGFETLRSLEATYGSLPPTLTCISGGGGEHRWYLAPPGARYVVAGPGVELITGRHAATLPPSVHRSGRPYRWAGGGPPVAFPSSWTAMFAPKIAPTSPINRPAVTDGTSYGASALRAECEAVAATPDGAGRNPRLCVAAFKMGQLVGAGLLDEGVAVAALLDAALANGMHERKSRDTIARGLRAGAQHPRVVAVRGGAS